MMLAFNFSFTTVWEDVLMNDMINCLKINDMTPIQESTKKKLKIVLVELKL